MNNLRKNKKGFTLIELVVVIAIVIILAAVAIPIVGQLQTSAKQSNLVSAASSAYSVVASYQMDAKNIDKTKLMSYSATAPGNVTNGFVDVTKYLDGTHANSLKKEYMKIDSAAIGAIWADFSGGVCRAVVVYGVGSGATGTVTGPVFDATNKVTTNGKCSATATDGTQPVTYPGV